jgi:hypothetical protein
LACDSDVEVDMMDSLYRVVESVSMCQLKRSGREPCVAAAHVPAYAA